MNTTRVPKDASETSLKNAIMLWLRTQDILAWRSPAGPFSTAGIPDIIGVLPGGRFLAIEAKRPGKYKDPVQGLTPAQSRMLVALGDVGALTIVTDTLQHVIEAITDSQKELSP